MVCSAPTVRAWLLELAGAAALAIAGVGLWALPTNTLVVGRPPTVVGWLCIIAAALLALLSTANYFGVDFQLPIRRRTTTKMWSQGQTPVPMPTPAAAPVPIPTSAPMRMPSRHLEAATTRTYSDATFDALVEMAKTPNLTAIQIDSLLAPYKGQWMAIQGVVDDVEKVVGASSVRVRLSQVNGEARRTATAWFDRGTERPAALHRGANVHVLGKILNIYATGMISLDDCEFSD